MTKIEKLMFCVVLASAGIATFAQPVVRLGPARGTLVDANGKVMGVWFPIASDFLGTGGLVSIAGLPVVLPLYPLAKSDSGPTPYLDNQHLIVSKYVFAPPVYFDGQNCTGNPAVDSGGGGYVWGASPSVTIGDGLGGATVYVADSSRARSMMNVQSYLGADDTGGYSCKSASFSGVYVFPATPVDLSTVFVAPYSIR